MHLPVSKQLEESYRRAFLNLHLRDHENKCEQINYLPDNFTVIQLQPRTKESMKQSSQNGSPYNTQAYVQVQATAFEQIAHAVGAREAAEATGLKRVTERISKDVNVMTGIDIETVLNKAIQ